MKSANGYVKTLDMLMASLEIRSYIRVMVVYDVAIVRPHRNLVGKAHELHLGTDGEDCNNRWYGVASTVCLGSTNNVFSYFHFFMPTLACY